MAYFSKALYIGKQIFSQNLYVLFRYVNILKIFLFTYHLSTSLTKAMYLQGNELERFKQRAEYVTIKNSIWIPLI